MLITDVPAVKPGFEVNVAVTKAPLFVPLVLAIEAMLAVVGDPAVRLRLVMLYAGQKFVLPNG
jgi:hypothetical protein